MKTIINQETGWDELSQKPWLQTRYVDEKGIGHILVEPFSEHNQTYMNETTTQLRHTLTQLIERIIQEERREAFNDGYKKGRLDEGGTNPVQQVKISDNMLKGRDTDWNGPYPGKYTVC